MIFKVQAQGDTIYLRANSKDAVPALLKKYFGFIPGSAYDVSSIEEYEVPANEEVLE